MARVFGGIDLRQHGSGNIGATNVARTMGMKWGLAVLALDALKGMLPVLLVMHTSLFAAAAPSTHVAVGCGLAAILGHMFPCWLGFRGGKGVATALGVVALLAWQATLIAAGVFLLVFALKRVVSLASMTAALVFAAVEFGILWPDPFSSETWSLAAFSLAAPLLIIVRHRDNIARLLRGEELHVAHEEKRTDPGERSPAERG